VPAFRRPSKPPNFHSLRTPDENRARCALPTRSTRDTNALIDAPGDVIRATVLLITVPRTLMPSPAQLIAVARKLIARRTI